MINETDDPCEYLRDDYRSYKDKGTLNKQNDIVFENLINIRKEIDNK